VRESVAPEMDLIVKRDNRVREQATASTPLVSAWQFVATGDFFVDDRDTESYAGEICYANPNYEIGPALKVRNWVFCLERMTPEARARIAPQNDPEAWVISAFHGPSHYSFIAIDAPDQRTLNDRFVTFVVSRFWPILHPESFDVYLEAAKITREPYKAKCTIVPFDKKKQQQPQTK
jgi:hypothetical protein